MNTLTLFKIGLLGVAAAGAYGAAVVSVDYVERTRLADVQASLDAQGIDWVTPQTDGMQIILQGKAPDEASRFRAMSLASAVSNPNLIRDRMTIPDQEDMPVIAYEIEMLRTGDDVLVLGMIPGSEATKLALVEAIGGLSPNMTVSDIVAAANAPASDAWSNSKEVGLAALAGLNDAHVEVKEAAVAVKGVLPLGKDGSAWQNALEAEAEAKNVALSVELRQARQRLSPFSLQLVNDGDGIKMSRCAVEQPQDADRISDALAAAGGSAHVNCQVALGAPDPQWPTAAEAVIASLDVMGSGAITVTDRLVTVLPDGTASEAELQAAANALREGLPDGYELARLSTKGLQYSDEGAELVVSRSPEGSVTIRGPQRNTMRETILSQIAAARFGEGIVTQFVTIDPDLPDQWGPHSLLALKALSMLSSGDVRMTANGIAVSGRSPDPNAKATIEAELFEHFDPADVGVEVVLDAVLSEPEGPDPETCVADINLILVENPIVFAPSSVEFDSAGLATIDEIATILRGCEGVAMEIGGHTDSQGRASSNLNLSQARADAVLDALSQRRVLTGEIYSKGYGATQPIADNSSEEGREANRRIAFRLTAPETRTVQETEDGSE